MAVFILCKIHLYVTTLYFSNNLVQMKLQKLSPILWTKDLKETISFYETVLGFKGKSNFPNFATLTRENVEIMFIVPQDELEDCKDPNDKKDFFPKPLLTGSIFIVME